MEKHSINMLRPNLHKNGMNSTSKHLKNAKFSLIFFPPSAGKHVINLFIQYTPYKPSDGNWADTAYRVSFPSLPLMAPFSICLK